MKKTDSSIFREYDIRGIWQQDIDEQFSFDLGRAFAKYMKKYSEKDKLTISIGYDARLSSKEIFRALAKGANYEDIGVINLGLVATPVQYFSLFNMAIDGGVMITASHNPKEYNGFKLSVDKETLFGDKIQEVKYIMESLDGVDFDKDVKKEIVDYNIIKDYTAYMLNEFGYLKQYKEKPRIVLDAGNGCGGFIAKPILDDLSFFVKGLFIEPDGTFPNHHPDPTVLGNIEDMRKTVVEGDYEAGIGYDGDADRIGVVLKDGTMLYGDQLLLLFAQDILREHKGAKIIGEVKCSQVLFDGVQKAGGKPIMWKAGHSLIKAKMKDENALLSGEMSGHIFFRDRYFGYDDAIYASLRLLELMTVEKIDILAWRNRLPKMFNTPEIRIDCPDNKKDAVVLHIIEYCRQDKDIIDINTIDGVRFNVEGGWGLVRKSNTQPAIVLRFEANANELLDDISGKFIGLVKKEINASKL